MAAFADDDGSADPQVRAALQASEDGAPASYLHGVVALCTARLLVPIMAAGDETMTADPEREGEVSAVLLQRSDGERALPVFTGSDAVASWHPKARPVPATLDKAAESALQQGAGSVVVDLAGPHPLVLERDVLEQLAQGRRLVALPEGEFGWAMAAGQD